MATVTSRSALLRSKTRSETEPHAAPEHVDERRPLSWSAIALVLAFGGSLLLLNLGGRALTYHEVLFAQPAREMLASGDLVLPRIVELPYPDKPPATAWAIAASMALLGRENEWTARLPSVAAELLIALVVAVVAANWFNRRTALVAACIQITSVYTLMQARLAEADLLLAAAVTVAWAAMALSLVPRPAGIVAAARHGRLGAIPDGAHRGLLTVVFYAAAGASFLIKGPLGPALILGGAASYALVARRRDVWRWFGSPVGIGLLLACVTLWPMAAYVAHPPILEAWRAHHWGRFRGELGGGQPPGFYLYTSLWLLLPWTPALIWALVKAGRNAQWREPLWQFVAAWTAPGFLLLSLSSFQHKHYVIPLLPLLAVPTAVGLFDYVRWRNTRPFPKPGVSAGLVLVATSLAIYLVVRVAPPATPGLVALFFVIGCGMLWLVYCEARQEPRTELVSMLALAWIGSAAALLLVMPGYDTYQSTRELGLEVDRQARRDGPTYLVGLPEHPATFYIREPLLRIDDPQRFLAAARTLRPVTHVLAPAHCADELRTLGDVRTLAAQRSLQRYLSESDRPTLFRVTRR